MLKTERNAKNFQMACNQHFGYAKTEDNLEIINLFSAFYAVVSKRFRTFAADISKTQTVRQSTGQIFSVGVQRDFCKLCNTSGLYQPSLYLIVNLAFI